MRHKINDGRITITNPNRNPQNPNSKYVQYFFFLIPDSQIQIPDSGFRIPDSGFNCNSFF
jgi:hypothetical protein